MELVDTITIDNNFEGEAEIEEYIEEYIAGDYHYDYSYNDKTVTIELMK